VISVDKFKNALDDLANSYQTGAIYGADAFNRQLPICVVDMVRSRLGLSEQYQPGQPVPAISYELTRVVTNELGELKITDYAHTVDAQGIAQLNEVFYLSSLFAVYTDDALKAKYDMSNKKSCGHLSGDDCACHSSTTQMSVNQKKMLRIKNASLYYNKQVPVNIVDDATFNMLRNNAIRVPTKQYPICRFQSNLIAPTNPLLEFLPKNIGTVYVTYIRYPAAAKWNYTLDAVTLTEIFDPVGSVDIDLPESLFTPLLGLMLGRLGIKSREGDIVNIGDKLNTQGK